MNDELVLYFNPTCSKCRGARALLDERGEQATIVEYLVAPPARAALARIVDLLDGPPSDLVRKDDNFRALGLDPAAYQTPDEVVELLLAHPELMERPVIVKGERAVIARPPERALELLDG